MANTGFLKQGKYYNLDYQPDANIKKFANVLTSILKSDFCENLTRYSAISSVAKIIIFRKSRKRLGKKETLAKFIHDHI